MGKAKFWPHRAPKPLNGFRWNLEYIIGRRYDHTCKSMWRCDNVGGLGEHVKKHMLWFLRCTFFCFILRLAPSAQMWTDFDDLYVIRRVSAQACAFWVSRSFCSPFWGQNPPKTPILVAWIGIFKLNEQNIKNCILSRFLHRLPPNFAQPQRPPTKSTWWSLWLCKIWL